MGLPVLAQPMTGTRVEWNGLDLRILRGYGVLAPHYELWTPSAGLARLWCVLCARPARLPVGCAVAGDVADCRRDSGLRHRYGGARPAAGDLADAGAALQQGLLPGPGDCGAHPFARQRAPAPAAAGADRAGARERDGANSAGRDGRRDRLPARRSCRWRAAAAFLPWAWCAQRPRLRNQTFTYTAGTAAGTARILAAPPTL